jgi:hypothetical protein
MTRQTVRFVSLLFTALAMIPAMAHLLELPNKIRMAAEQYLVVQQIYRGWAFAGIVVVGAFVSTLALTIISRRERPAFAWALMGLLCVAATQVMFWLFTYPVNQATQNWSVLPDNWLALREQWEYSHAASALLNLTAFIAVSALVVNGPAAERDEVTPRSSSRRAWPHAPRAGHVSQSRELPRY